MGQVVWIQVVVVRTRILITAAAIAIMAITGCAHKTLDSSGLIGTWTSQTPRATFVFNEDGSATANSSGTDVQYTYRIMNKTMVVMMPKSGGTGMALIFSPKEQSLTLYSQSPGSGYKVGPQIALVLSRT